MHNYFQIRGKIEIFRCVVKENMSFEICRHKPAPENQTFVCCRAQKMEYAYLTSLIVTYDLYVFYCSCIIFAERGRTLCRFPACGYITYNHSYDRKLIKSICVHFVIIWTDFRQFE